MDRDYYSEKTINQFIRKDVCQNDKLLYKYYQLSNAKKFRRRLQILKVDHKKIEQTVYVFITDSIRDIILQFIGKLTEHVKPMGDLIISGGEAFNTYFSQEDRIVTSDIDTKFVPIMKSGNGRLIGPGYYKYFGYLQAIKLILWDYLGKNCNRIGKLIKKRLQLIKSDKITKILGIRLPLSGPTVTRRYTLIRKQKQSKNNSNNITAGNVLIDVELFTLDMKIRYFSTSDNKISTRNLGGILDIAFMRPGELGYDVSFDKQRGYTYRNQKTNKLKYNPNIIIASKRFLLEDLYLMQTLGLRPDKKEKDRKRMYNFATKILGIKNVNSSDDVYNIFKKSEKVLSMKTTSKQYISSVPKSFYEKAKKINPYKWVNRTTQPLTSKVIGQFLVGFKGPRGLSVKGIKETSGPFRFDTKSKRWVKNTNNSYVKNEYDYRPNNQFKSNINVNALTPKNVLYGYNPRRNEKMSEAILNRASLIPLIGIKNLGI